MRVETLDLKHADSPTDGSGVDPGHDAPPVRADRNLSDAMIDEWGRQSFPASDPPSNW